MGLPCTELLKTMAENDKKCFELLYGTTHTGKRINFNKSLLMLSMAAYS